MKERPILFSAPMVRAILDGRKTQTRRVVKEWQRYVEHDLWECRNVLGGFELSLIDAERGHPLYCPYGHVGDRLWVRESWNEFDPIEVTEDRRGNRAPYVGCQGARKIPWVAAYAADGALTHQSDGTPATWRPSIHMPRWASRITLEVTGVRVERLQSITTMDAMAEGTWPRPNAAGVMSYTTGFHRLWESINGAASWEANPWVWAVEFRRLPQPGGGKP